MRQSAVLDPEHLIAGSQFENMEDMDERGRRFTKLNEDTIREIRKLYSTGEYSHRDLGRKFHVAHATIGMLLRGETWQKLGGYK